MILHLDVEQRSNIYVESRWEVPTFCPAVGENGNLLCTPDNPISGFCETCEHRGKPSCLFASCKDEWDRIQVLLKKREYNYKETYCQFPARGGICGKRITTGSRLCSRHHSVVVGRIRSEKISYEEAYNLILKEIAESKE